MRLGWFSSGRGPGSQALLAAACKAIESGLLPIEIAYVFCNRAPGEHEPADRFLDLARSYGLPVVTLSSYAFRREAGGDIARVGEPLPAWRIEYDLRILELVKPFQTGTAMLAGYQLIAPELCRHLNLINLHPAAPGGPVGLWQEVIWQLIESGANESGITMFLATPELDAGPPISLCTYGLRDQQTEALWRDVEAQGVSSLRSSQGEASPLFLEIRRRGAIREAPLMLATLTALAEGRIGVGDGRVVDGSGRTAEPVDLSPEVDRAIESSL